MLIEQNANVALGMADRGFVMRGGKIIVEDLAKNLLQRKDLMQLYLGEKLV